MVVTQQQPLKRIDYVPKYGRYYSRLCWGKFSAKSGMPALQPPHISNNAVWRSMCEAAWG
eukprot:scaffold202164_cov66-Cyclotella_meneghiniana.AAC.1